ncbi:hypothetical protein BJ508DRAFT_331853, partial [Ascobolus immersus RN42]
ASRVATTPHHQVDTTPRKATATTPFNAANTTTTTPRTSLTPLKRKADSSPLVRDMLKFYWDDGINRKPPLSLRYCGKALQESKEEFVNALIASIRNKSFIPEGPPNSYTRDALHKEYTVAGREAVAFAKENGIRRPKRPRKEQTSRQAF